MSVAVQMPKAGITVEACILGEWYVAPGDRVEVGDKLFSYETDKSVFECKATTAGVVLELFYEEGDEIPVFENVCAIGEEGEDVSALKLGSSVVLEDKSSEPADEKKNKEAESALIQKGFPKSDGKSSGVKASPRSRNLAARKGIDLNTVEPTGPYGRIIERDVLLAEPGSYIEAESGGSVMQDVPSIETGYEDIRLKNIRKIIATSMSDSLQTAAQLTHHHSFDATAIMQLREDIKKQGEKMGLPNITLNDIIIFAVSRTLVEHPDLNAHMLENHIVRRFRDVHMGIAVDTPNGLVVPTLFFANRKSLYQIAEESRKLIQTARANKLMPEQMQGATFTISNLGTEGVEMFTPIINLPQTGILGICKAIPRFRETESGFETYPAMGLSLTYDHRAVDGAPASRFAAALGKNLENIALLLMK